MYQGCATVPSRGLRVITRIQLLRNIGQFDSVSAGATIPLACLTLVYSENGRGKTTLAAILRSLATGDPVPIAERRRLTAQHPPHVVLECSGGPPPALFENNAWNRTYAGVLVFDDLFIDQNVHSGLAVQVHHRHNLHDLILGARAVALSGQLQDLVARIEDHNMGLTRFGGHLNNPVMFGGEVSNEQGQAERVATGTAGV